MAWNTYEKAEVGNPADATKEDTPGRDNGTLETGVGSDQEAAMAVCGFIIDRGVQFSSGVESFPAAVDIPIRKEVGQQPW